MIEIFGIIGSTLLAISSIPQVMISIKNGNSNGLSVGMLWPWFMGVICMLLYAFLKYKDFALCINYGANSLFVAILLKYKYFPRQ